MHGCLSLAELSLSLAVISCAQSPYPPDNSGQASTGSLALLGEMREARALHSATQLNDGRVLIVGGGTPETGLASAEIYDPMTRSSVVLSLSERRLGHTATKLADGRVLIVGGGYGLATSARSAELFDPIGNTFTRLGPTVSPRADHSAVLLSDGRVLIVGGDPSGVGSNPTSSTELFDPTTGRFVRAADLGIPRRPYGVVRLQDGRVLVAGGTTTGRRVVTSAEVYDPATNTFGLTGTLSTAREKHTAANLPDGKVLIAGGSNGSSESNRIANTEIYDPVSGQFSAGPSMTSPRHKVVSATLPNGDVLIIGGSGELAELYRRDMGQFVRVGESTGKERFYPAGVALVDGRVLITGGYTVGGSRPTIWAYSRQLNQ